MSLKCLLGKHDWSRDCEKCVKCGETRVGFHRWSGCKCSTCGETRDEAHSWQGCKCSVCLEIRDESHDFKGCECAICGKARDETDTWQGCDCPRCEEGKRQLPFFIRMELDGKIVQKDQCAQCGRTLVGMQFVDDSSAVLAITLLAHAASEALVLCLVIEQQMLCVDGARSVKPSKADCGRVHRQSGATSRQSHQFELSHQ